jgi:hypothetical protein
LVAVGDGDTALWSLLTFLPTPAFETDAGFVVGIRFVTVIPHVDHRPTNET